MLLDEANWERVKRQLAPKVSDVEESGNQGIERAERPLLNGETEIAIARVRRLPYFSANSICNCFVVLLFAITERLVGSYRKYAPGMAAAMRSIRCRASEKPSTHSSQKASLSEVPEKISNVGSFMADRMPGAGRRLQNFGCDRESTTTSFEVT